MLIRYFMLVFINNTLCYIFSQYYLYQVCAIIFVINIILFPYMKISQKNKKLRPHELSPLNIAAKTQYKPYFGGLPNKRSKDNILSMGPLENIMFDIPQIQQVREPVQLSSVEKLRAKVHKFFQQKSVKSKDQWELYMRKSQIVESTDSGWAQVQCFLLKIIADLFAQCKTLFAESAQLQKYKQNQENALNYDRYLASKTAQHLKLDDRMNKSQYNCFQSCQNQSKVEYIGHDYSTITRNSGAGKNKNGGKSQIKGSMYNFNEDASYTQCNSMINNNNANQGEQKNLQQFKISKLEKEIQLYKDKIRQIQEDNKLKLGQMEKKIEVELQLKYSETMQEKMKYQNEVESKKFYNDILAQQYKSLKKKHQELETEHEQMRKQYMKLKEDKSKMQGLYQYKQMWLMQYEEILGLNQQIYRLKADKQVQINKNKGLKQKLKQLSKNFNYNYNVSMENEKDRQDLNKVLKDFRDWLKFFAVPRVSKGMMNNNTFFPQMNFDTSKENFAALLPKDDATNYKLLRPNFFIYFEAYQGIIMAERKFPQRKVMPPNFYLTIRAILDAMYLHFNFTCDFKQWIGFPEFVISFLQKFEVNNQTKKPMLRKIPCQSEQKINFLLNVFNIEAANSWQCQTFRSFIMQQFTLDELYFYLDCRDDLLRGSQLNNNFGSSDSITYIRVNIAEEVIKDKLRNYDREMLDRMKKFLNSKKKIKYNRELIDLNFVLKLLLQVYSIQKIKSERFFHHNFKSKSSTSKISYTEYSAFMSKNFQYLTITDIAKLYREMYTLGVSHITYKTIHYVCSMRGLFIPLLRAKLGVKGQNYGGQWRTSNITSSVQNKVFEDIIYLDLQNSLNNMVVSVEQFGVENIIGNNISINKFLHDCDSLKMRRSNFQYRLLHETEKILMLRSMLAWKNQKNIVYQQLTKDKVRERLGYLLSIIHQSDDDVGALKKWRQSREKAIVKLTRNFKIRIQQSLAEFKVTDKKQYEDKIAQVEANKNITEEESDNQKQGEGEQGQKVNQVNK